MQVSQYKFIFLKIMSRLNFGELMRFFAKRFDPFKIQKASYWNLLLTFITTNLESFRRWDKKENCSIWVYLAACQVWRTLGKGRSCFCIFQFEALEPIWKSIWKLEKPLKWYRAQSTSPVQPSATPIQPTMPTQLNSLHARTALGASVPASAKPTTPLPLIPVGTVPTPPP
jgi:hypothetical protein